MSVWKSVGLIDITGRIASYIQLMIWFCFKILLKNVGSKNWNGTSPYLKSSDGEVTKILAA